MDCGLMFKDEYYLIEHPGVIVNVENAIRTLGGEKAIIDALSNNKTLELRYQPDNMYQNGVVADKKSAEVGESGHVQLVFKIRRKKSDHSQFQSQCLGIIKTVFSFKTLYDFHFLPIQTHPKITSPSERIYEDMVPRLIPTTIQDTFSWWTHKESLGLKVPSLLPPFIYSRYISASQTKILVQESDRIVQGTNPTVHGQNLRSERKALTITVQGNEDFPSAPTEAAVADVDSRIKRAETHRLIKDLFNERPMWSRIAIYSRTGLEDNTLKILMAKYGFYILSGPWGRLWCRFGYDPRKISDAKRYQTIMVSFRKHTQIPERQRLRFNQNDRQVNNMGIYDYIYKPNHLPAVRQIWYSICDIELPTAQKILRHDFYGTLKECDPSTGWLPPKVIEDIRNAIKDNVRKASQLMDDTESVVVSEESDDQADNDDEFDASSSYAWQLFY